MAPSSVKNRIKIWDAPTTTWSHTSVAVPINGLLAYRPQIESYIDRLYGTSRGFQLLSSGNSDIRLANVATGLAFYQRDTDPWVGFEFSKISDVWWFNTEGVLVNGEPILIFSHELVHLLEGLYDLLPVNTPITDMVRNTKGFDPQGDTVKVQNVLAEQLGLKDQIRVSYEATLESVDGRFVSITQGVSYTSGNQIDIARIGFAGNDVQDHSARDDNSSDLILGLGGDDYIHGGGGDDHLYGGDGDDTLFGGLGDDRLFGEEGDDVLTGNAGADLLHGGHNAAVSPGRTLNADGNDTADYSSFLDGPSKLGFEIGVGFTLTSSAYAAEVDFDRAVFVKDLVSSVQRDGATDTLISIEKIVGTTSDDRLMIGSLDAKFLADSTGRGGLREIDLGAEARSAQGGDVIDLSALGEAAEVELGGANPHVSARADSARTIAVSGAERVIGTAQGDLIKGAGNGSFIDGGAGDDEIHLFAGDMAIGGPGADSFYLSTTMTAPDGSTSSGVNDVLILDISSEDRIYVDGVLYTGYYSTVTQGEGRYYDEIGAIDYEYNYVRHDSFVNGTSSITYGSSASFASGSPDLRLTNLAKLKFNYAEFDTRLTVDLLNFEPSDAGLAFSVGYVHPITRQYGDWRSEIRYTDGLDFNPEPTPRWFGDPSNEYYATLALYSDYTFTHPVSNLAATWADTLPEDLEGRDQYISLLRNQGAGGAVGSPGDDLFVALTTGGTVFGGAGSDTFIGKDGNDTFYGGDGNDVFFGSSGKDFIDGGAGLDTLHLAGFEADYVIGDAVGGETLITSAMDPGLSTRVINVENIVFDGDPPIDHRLSDVEALSYIASYADLRQGYGADPESGRWHYENFGQFESRTISF